MRLQPTLNYQCVHSIIISTSRKNNTEQGIKKNPQIQTIRIKHRSTNTNLNNYIPGKGECDRTGEDDSDQKPIAETARRKRDGGCAVKRKSGRA